MFRSARSLALRTAVVLATAAVSACGIDSSDLVDVAVQPRVVLDGTVELADRTAGRVIIDEVVAHAPSARLRAAVAGDTGDVVVDADDPLLFRYVLADRTGFGAALGGERTWSMPAAGAALSVFFGPSTGPVDDVDSGSSVLDGLAGHTAIIHGTIAIETDVKGGFGGFGDVDPDGTPAQPVDEASDVDPDGTPASSDVDPDGTPASSDVDPDGTPADVDPDGTPADVDPDGTPADVDPDGTPADVDPDGTPADVDPDGTAADVDPDGTAADVGPDGVDAEARTLDRGSSKGSTARASGTRRAVVQVPFSLVIDGSFDREVLLSSGDIGGVGCGEVMPIDLHLSTDDLFDSERLDTLAEIARKAVARDDVDAAVSMQVTGSQTAAATTVTVPGSIRRPKKVTDGSSHIKVSSVVRR